MSAPYLSSSSLLLAACADPTLTASCPGLEPACTSSHPPTIFLVHGRQTTPQRAMVPRFPVVLSVLPRDISHRALPPLACLVPRSLVQWLSVGFPLLLFLLLLDLDVVVQRPSLRGRLVSSDPQLDLGFFPHIVSY
jgi:hypothetical protein